MTCHSPEGCSGWSLGAGPLCPGKTGSVGLRTDVFRRRFYEPRFLQKSTQIMDGDSAGRASAPGQHVCSAPIPPPRSRSSAETSLPLSCRLPGWSPPLALQVELNSPPSRCAMFSGDTAAPRRSPRTDSVSKACRCPVDTRAGPRPGLEPPGPRAPRAGGAVHLLVSFGPWLPP